MLSLVCSKTNRVGNEFLEGQEQEQEVKKQAVAVAQARGNSELA